MAGGDVVMWRNYRLTFALVAILLFLALNRCYGQDQDQALYRWSLIAAASAQTADIASSWGGIEANPRLGRGREFGWQATSIKLAVVGGGLLIQRYVLRRHPRATRIAAIVNFSMAGATAGVAARNWRTR